MPIPGREKAWRGYLASEQGRPLSDSDFELRPSDRKESPDEETQGERTASECRSPGLEISLSGLRNKKRANVVQAQEMREGRPGKLMERSWEQILSGFLAQD